MNKFLMFIKKYKLSFICFLIVLFVLSCLLLIKYLFFHTLIIHKFF
jgi:hypothetical protein